MDTLVVDIGSHSVKAGFSGDDLPSYIIQSYAGKISSCVSKSLLHDAHTANSNFIGYQLERYRPILQLSKVIQHGVVVNWDNMEELLHNTIYDGLQVEPEDYPLLLTEHSLNPSANKEKFTQILFETFSLPAIYFGNPGVLTLYSAGRSTGITVNSGAGVTQIDCIYDGYWITGDRINFGGDNVTDYLERLLTGNCNYRWKSCERYLLDDIKENLCYVAPSKEINNENDDILLEKLYVLPDGEFILIDTPLREATESIFKFVNMDIGVPGLASLINKSVTQCGMDSRKDLYSNIVLSGGNTLFSGFKDRLVSDLKEILPSTINPQIFDEEDKYQKYHVFRGGSILSSMPDFPNMCKSKEEYDESGPGCRRRGWF